MKRFIPLPFLPRKLCVYVAVGFLLHFNPTSVVCTHKTKKFPIHPEKISTFNECLFSLLKQSHSTRRTAARPINSNVYWKQPQRAEIFRTHSIRNHLTTSNNFESFAAFHIFRLPKENPLLKRHFAEYILVWRGMEKETKCEKAFWKGLKRTVIYGSFKVCWLWSRNVLFPRITVCVEISIVDSPIWKNSLYENALEKIPHVGLR